ncbi:unnamed protein product [Peronospora belbahrii]|uniref:FYVE-type domain-containing protein n=1 Tax=Peronospora belbahrii TaxID=622444 RepID=A0AAU9KUE9_9STRA|nr:unnamed protein product [Peronospora belbahrii]CAH0513938.1 unnamed protein product [Peronospora belbahrii]
MSSMFPIVEESYRVKITDDMERDLRFLGQSRLDALTSPFAMKLFKEKSGLQLYELCEKEFYTMKAVTTVNAPLQEVMHMLRMDTTAQLRETMKEIFGTLFLDGVVLYNKPNLTTRSNESMSVSWAALQASKPNLPHRDYVFLRYGDIFERCLEHGNMYQDNGSGLYIGASIWESIKLDGCEPLPPSQNVVRLRLRRSGFVVEETGQKGALRISMFLSESHPGRDAVSSLTRSWMMKVVSCVVQTSNVLLTRALGSKNLLTKGEFQKNGRNCYMCLKAFTVFHRKHHCRVCGDVVCSGCSDMKTLHQLSGNKEVRLCSNCCITSTTSVLPSHSGSDSMCLSQSNSSCQSLLSISNSFNGCNLASSNVAISGSVTNVLDSSNETACLKTHSLEHDGSFDGQRSTDSPVLNSTNEFNQDGNNSPVEEEFNTISEFSDISEFHWTEEVPGPSVDLAQIMTELTVRANTPFSYALQYSSRQKWPKAPIPLNEAARLKKVRELQLADPGKQFQEMCEYSTAELGCQIATISFIGDKSGFLMAKVGLEKRELPRNVLMDAHAIMSTEPTVILDATEDLRFVNNPFVTNGRVRFFAGFPMVTSDGYVVGSFNVADPFARELLSGDKFLFLRNLADVIIRSIEQNTLMSIAVQRNGGNVHHIKSCVHAPAPPGSHIADKELTMQELMCTAYTTECQVRMQE